MKKLILPVFLSACFCVLFISCSKSNDNPSFSATPAITGSINENAFIATSVSSTITSTADTANLVIKGLDVQTNRTIYIKLINYNYTAGSFAVDSPAIHAVAYYQQGSVITYGKAGSVRIYNVTPGLVQGTFDFTMKDNTKLIDMEVKGQFTVAPQQ